MAARKSKPIGLIDPQSAVFAKVFSHLVPGVLCRQLSIAQIQQRAWSEILNLARSVVRCFDSYDETLADEMAFKFVMRVFSSDLMNKYNPERGEIGKFLWGIMRFIALECFRERSRRRREIQGDQSFLDSIPSSREPEPSVIPERNDQIQRVRTWVMELPPDQRNAVARRFEVLADLDSGGFIPNEAVALCRGLKRLREKAMEAEVGAGTE
jgi:DNA-directed RNA polymerase specialized sigma24 family protein